jgi:hypothetical protein
MHEVFVSLPQELFPNLFSVITCFLIYFVLGIEKVSILFPSTFTQLNSELQFNMSWADMILLFMVSLFFYDMKITLVLN